MTGDNTLIHSHGINRRDFMKLCAALAATMGLSSKAAAEMAESVTNPQRPPVIWIGAQECTGCTESLLRATHPTVENLVLETISLEYHEVLSAAFGHQVEENKHNALEKYKGQYVLVVDGSIPLKDNGICAYSFLGSLTSLSTKSNMLIWPSKTSSILFLIIVIPPKQLLF
ncbi:hydrogenase small subunit [Bradyrhizobium sp. WBOS04]|uniref:hydrogenase small subunit n=1 Tax=Bradyrhizobium sp. WBOS04 TaxID=2171498 RepID=UPI00211F350E|nr:hydrogenase small subunit [Bradyrhizobium sp. WBOS04]